MQISNIVDLEKCFKNALTLAIVGADTAENGPSKVRPVSNKNSTHLRLAALVAAVSLAALSRSRSQAPKAKATGDAELTAGEIESRDVQVEADVRVPGSKVLGFHAKWGIVPCPPKPLVQHMKHRYVKP